jgi:hypothetical protein
MRESRRGTGGSFSLDALWDAIKAELQWFGQVAEAALQVLGDLIAGLIELRDSHISENDYLSIGYGIIYDSITF